MRKLVAAHPFKAMSYYNRRFIEMLALFVVSVLTGMLLLRSGLIPSKVGTVSTT